MSKNNRLTQSVIVGLATLVSTASWIGLKNILYESGNWLWPTIGFFILLIFLSLNWLVSKSRAILMVTLGLILVSFLFSFGLKIEYLAILTLALLLLTFGSFRAINEKNARIKIETIKIIPRGLPYILTGLSLVIATTYYLSPLSLGGQNQIQIPRPVFDVLIWPISGTIEEQVPVSQLSEQLSISVEAIEISNGQIQEILYQAANRELNKFSEPYKEYFPLGLAIGIFLALRVMAVPFGWLVILSSWLIFKALIALGAIKIQEKAVLKEVIEV